MASSNMINNFPVTFRGIKNSNKIVGPDIPSMKGKSVRSPTEAVVVNYVEIPKNILEMKINLEVSVDFISVNKIPFPESISKRLGFATVKVYSEPIGEGVS